MQTREETNEGGDDIAREERQKLEELRDRLASTAEQLQTHAAADGAPHADDAEQGDAPRHFVLGARRAPATPDDAAAVVERFFRHELREIFDADGVARVTGLDRAEVTAHLLTGEGRGSEAHAAGPLGIDIDLTGFEVEVDAGSDEPPEPPELPAFGDERHRVDTGIAEVRLRAAPATIQGADVAATITAGGVHLDWAEDDRGQLALSLRQRTVRGELATIFPVDTLDIDLAAQQQAVVEALASVVRDAAAAQGITLSKLELTLRQAGPRGVHLHASGHARRGILGASLLFTTEAQLDDELRLQFLKPRLTSRNPVIGLLLLAVRGQISHALADPVELRELQLEPLRLAEVQFEVGERLRLRLRYT